LLEIHEKEIIKKSVHHYQNYLRSTLNKFPKSITMEEYSTLSEKIRKLLEKLK